VSQVWLIGACPSRAGAPALRPTGGRAGSADRLRVMLDMTVEEFTSSFRCANVLRRGPWDLARAKRGAAVLRGRLTLPALVLGRDAWRALRLPGDTEFFEMRDGFVLLPHPSGRNRVWNDRERSGVLLHVVNAVLDR